MIVDLEVIDMGVSNPTVDPYAQWWVPRVYYTRRVWPGSVETHSGLGSQVYGKLELIELF